MQGSFSSGTCTDDPLPVPCTQLRTNRCVPLLWLPASLCLQLSSSEEGKNSDRTGCSEGYCVNTDINNTNVRRAVQQMSGFERNVLFEVLRQPFASMQSMQNLFPASESYYCEDAVLELLVHVATDATSIVPSRWASMEAHRDIAIVMVVLNCHEHEPNSAVRAINTVFQRHFTRCACRCVVLDPLEDTVADMPKDVVLTVSTRTPLKDVVIRVLSDIATATVRHLNTRIVEIMASHAAVRAIPRTATVGSSDGFNRFMIPGNVDDSSNSNSRNSNMVQQDVSTCGMMKRKGDLLLSLGAFDFALSAYEEALAGADNLWCSIILESVVTLRFLQNASLFVLRSSAVSVLTCLASDAASWSNEMKKAIERVEGVVTSLQNQQRRALSSLKHSMLLTSLVKKLTKEVEEPLTVQRESLQKRSRAIVGTHGDEKKGPMSPERVEKYAKRVLTCLKQIVHLSFYEMHLYLNEAAQLLHSCGISKTLLLGRLVNIHLKRSELFAEQGDKRAMLESLSSLKMVASQTGDLALQQHIRMRNPYICAQSGCWRKAFYYITEAALAERREGRNDVAVFLLWSACRLVGVPLPKVGFGDGLVEFAEKQRQLELARHSTANIAAEDDDGKARRESLVAKCLPHKAQSIPLLVALLDAVSVDGIDSGIRCAVAALLLFNHYPFLSDDKQRYLLSIIAQGNTRTHLFLRYSTPPFLDSMKVLALPPHLQPKTIPLGGAQFTFIDTGRLKMTVLTLNGKIIPQDQVVWSVGSVGEVAVVLKNPLRRVVRISSIALNCRWASSLDDDGVVTESSQTCDSSFCAPCTYVVTDVVLQPRSKVQIHLNVEPRAAGFLAVGGIDLRFGDVASCAKFLIPLEKSFVVPVLEELPIVSCTLDVNEVEIFCGQTVEFMLRLSNTGRVTAHRLQITAHDDCCQMDTCDGCKQRVDSSSLYATLEDDSPVARGDGCILRIGESTSRRVTVKCPASSDKAAFQHIVFRVSTELPYETPASPPGIPSVVPIFAVIPRVVHETYLRVREEPSLVATSLSLSRDRRYVEIRVRNDNKLHTIELLCSHIHFATLPNALIISGAEYLIPPIKITSVPQGLEQLSVPWIVREHPKYRGLLSIDFSAVSSGVTCTEPLEEALVTLKTLDCLPGFSDVFCAQRWRSSNEESKKSTLFTLPVMKPVQVQVSVSAPWRREVQLRIRLAMEQQALDMSVLSGAVDTVAIVGGEEEEVEGHTRGRLYENVVEVFAFKEGEHPLLITLSDPDGREIVHAVEIQWKHV